MKYEMYKPDGSDFVTPCESCFTDDVSTALFGDGDGKRPPRRLCRICAETYIGSITEFPQSHRDADLYRSLAQCTNMVLKELAELRRQLTP